MNKIISRNKKEGKVRIIKISPTDNIQGVLEKARKKFGKDAQFAFAEWPDTFPYGSLRLIVKGGKR